MSLAASAPVLVPAPGGSRGAWTPHALIAWTAAFAALGIAVAVGFAWWQTHLGPARVWVDATVDGAEVSIDDGAPRSAGAALMLAPGASHTVSITKPGYKKVTRHVVVERGQTAYIMASMRPIPALSVRGPSGLEVFVNDVVVGATPLSDVAIEGEGLARITVGAWHWSVDLDQTPVVRLEVPLPW